MSKTAAVAALLALSLCWPARAQEIQPADESHLLETLGEFLRSGLAPPRTAADLAREEERARQAGLTAPPPAPEPAVEPAPAAPPVPVVAKPPAPAVAAPVARPAAEPPELPAAVPPAPPAAGPPALPAAGPPAPRPKAIVVPRPAAEPIPESERIAGTATLDQAVKLGGPLELYTRRPVGPAGN